MVNHKTDIRLVNTHSESDSCNNHPYFIVHPTFLNVLFLIFGNISMVIGCLETLLIEFQADFLAFFSGKTIDYSCLIFMPMKDLFNLLQNVLSFGFNFVIKIRSVERGSEEVAIVYTQPTDYILFDNFSHSGSQRQNRSLGKPFLNGRQIFILDSKLLSPSGDTMHFIYNDSL
jgi:hypothetical protein